MGYVAGTANGGPVHVIPLDNPLKKSKKAVYHECMASTEDGVAASLSGGALASSSSVGPLGGTDSKGHPGIIAYIVTTASTDFLYVGAGSGTVLFGGGSYEAMTLMAFSSLSTGVDEYIYRFGYLDGTTNADSVDGVWIEYDRTISGNWIMVTATNSTRTRTASTIPVVAGAWILLTIEVNSTGTIAEYFINGSSIGTITTNIPITTGRQTGEKMFFGKTVGTTTRNAYHDFFSWKADLTTARF